MLIHLLKKENQFWLNRSIKWNYYFSLFLKNANDKPRDKSMLKNIPYLKNKSQLDKLSKFSFFLFSDEFWNIFSLSNFQTS